MTSVDIANLINLGAAGAVIIVTFFFLRFIRERDKDWRDFFTSIRTSDNENNTKLTTVLDKLVQRVESLEEKFDKHDATEMEFLRGVVARIDEPKTQPRKRA